MSDITPKEAIANLNHLYGMVAPDIQRSFDLAIKALEERPKGDLISRKALIEELKEHKYLVYNNNSVSIIQNNEIERCISIVEDAKTVDISRICMEHYKQGRKDEKAEANGELWQSFSP